MNTTYMKAIELNAAVNKLSTKGTSVDTVLNVLAFKDELQKKVEAYLAEFKELMKSYSVKADKSGNYEWADREDTEEITEKYNELTQKETTLERANRLEDADTLRMTQGMTIGEVAYFRSYLSKAE